MSHYARNHLQDDWATDATNAATERLRAADRSARWYFDQATFRQQRVYAENLNALLEMSGPKWDRVRDDERRRFAESTAEAGALLEQTVNCLLDTGEVSDELDAAWTALCERQVASARTSNNAGRSATSRAAIDASSSIHEPGICPAEPELAAESPDGGALPSIPLPRM